MLAIWKFIKREPIVISQVLTAMLTFGAAFGLNMTPAQTASIVGLGALLAALVGRANATPNATAAAQVATALYTPVPAAPASPAVAAILAK